MARPAPPNRRSDILAAAREEFNARGFAAARMEAIAARVGVSKAALYLQFRSKQALFEALISETIEAMLPQAAPDAFGDLPAETLLRRFIEFMAGRMLAPDMAFVARVIIGEGMNFPDLARFYHDHVISRGLGILERIVQHGVSRGEFVSRDPVQACRSIVGGMLLAATWKLTFEPVGAEYLDGAAFAQGHAETILSGLLVRPGAEP